MMVISAITELFTVAMVLPFLVILSNPKEAYNYQFIKIFAKIFNINNQQDLILPIAIGFVIISILAAILKTATYYFSGQTAAAITSYWGKNTFKKILYQEYGFHLNNNTNDFIVDLTTQLDQCELAIELFYIVISGSILIFVVLISTLLLIPKIAISAFVFISIVYLFFAYISKERLLVYSNNLAFFLSKRQKVLDDAFTGIKQILIDSSQNFYINLFNKYDIPRRKISQKSVFISYSPKFLIEGFGLALLAIIGILFMKNDQGGLTIAILGTFALAAQKLMPVFQQIFNANARIKICSKPLKSIVKILNFDNPEERYFKQIKNDLIFEKALMKRVYFKYSSSNDYFIEDLNVEITRNQKIGILGKSGSGKSTFADILMGLHKPNLGNIFVNEININENKNKDFVYYWRQIISTVPQEIFIADSTFAENIAFGIDKNKIDLLKVKKAAKVAQIDEYIMKRKNDYFSPVGEGGAFLSGGQRQRIAIARALYKNAQLIILDEATSGLDQITEEKLLKDIYSLKNLTLIIISHNFSTLKNCDLIYKLESNKLKLLKKINNKLN